MFPIRHGTYIRGKLRICCAHMKENVSVRSIKIRFVTTLDINKYNKQRFLLMCAPITELPYNISTMLRMEGRKGL